MQLKNLLNIAAVLFLAVPSFGFSRDCETLNKELIKNVKKNLRKYETLKDFKPLKECYVTKSGGHIDSMYLISERLDKSVVKKALSHKTIETLTYFVDDDFYQREPAVYSDFPTVINKLPKLRTLTLKYNLKRFNHGAYPYTDRKINPKVLALTSKKIKTITLDHIEINADIIKQLKKLPTLKVLNVISGDEDDQYATSKHDKNYKQLQSLVGKIEKITLDGKTVKKSKSKSKKN